MSGIILGGGGLTTLADEAPPSEIPVIQWSGPDGVTIPLSDPAAGSHVLWGVTGLGFMPFDLVTDQATARSGSILGSVNATEREVFIPILLRGNGFHEVRKRVATLARSMDPRDGDGEIQVLYPGGGGRRLVCRYKSGLEAPESDDAWLSDLRLPLVFLANEPAWLDVDSITKEWVLGEAHAFFPMKLPLRLSSSRVLGDVKIVNPGDEDAFPVWTITGPATSVTITNGTTGKSFELTGSLGADDVVVIDTRPDYLTVTDQDDVNLWPRIAPNPTMWALRPGSNEVDLNLAGASTGSSVRLDVVPRYKTAW